MTIEEILARLDCVKCTNQRKGQYEARCPAHDDKKASLAISTGEHGEILIHCHAGCDTASVLSAMGLKKSDLFNDKPPEKKQTTRKIVARYNYADIDGKLLNQKTRWLGEDGNKTFTWSHKEGSRWVSGKQGNDVLYNLPVLKNYSNIYVAEGEKDVETLSAMGLAAVCGAHGAGKDKWLPQYTEALKGKNVVVLQDNDEIGKAFAIDTCNALAGNAASVKLIDLTRAWPQLPKHGDISDIAASEDKQSVFSKLMQLVKDTKEWAFDSFEGFEGKGKNENQGFAPFAPFAAPNENQLPTFPVECLPPALGEYVKSVSDNIQVSVDMAAVSALAVCAICVQRKFIINPKPGWIEPLNLYAVIVAKPSERKSPVMKSMTRYIYEYIKAENNRRAPEIETYKTQRTMLENAIESIMKAKTKDEKSKLKSIMEKKRELWELEPVRPMRLIADDVTPEALTSLLADNGGKMAVISAEGGIFETMSGMYNNKVNIDAVLKAYSGDYIQVDRKGRQSESIEYPALTILLFIQFLVLNNIMENDTFRGRGMLARFLYSIPQSVVGNRNYNTKAVDPDVKRGYENLLYSLLSIPDQSRPEVIYLSDEASDLSMDFFNELEPRLIGDLEEIEEWAGKYHGQVMRIAGIIHCCIHGENATNEPVSGDTFQNAITIGKYFLEHAKAAFQIMGLGESPDVKDAKYILKRFESTGKTEMSKRDLHQLCKDKKRFEQSEYMEPILQLLIDHGYIRIEKVQTGGRPTENIILSPDYLTQNPQNPQNPQKSRNE